MSVSSLQAHITKLNTQIGSLKEDLAAQELLTASLKNCLEHNEVHDIVTSIVSQVVSQEVETTLNQQVTDLTAEKASLGDQAKDLTAEKASLGDQVKNLTAEKASLATTNSRLKAALVTVALVAGGVIAVVKNPGAVNSTLDSLKALVKR